jgi:hypothetical protein
VNIQKRLLSFITWSNWVLLLIVSLSGFFLAPFDFFAGILAGGLLVNINFHLLYRTLRKALTPPHLASPNVVLVKYYIRFLISGIVIFFLIKGHYVNPIGLFVGLSVVVFSIMLATLCELKHFFLKEATGGTSLSVSNKTF